MAATQHDVERWIKTGKQKGATYVISVCDTFEHDDYPVYVMPEDDLDEVKKKYDGVNMQKINEVIKL
jgi:alpha-L-fucosidase